MPNDLNEALERLERFNGFPSVGMRKAFNDGEFHRKYKKLTGEDPEPITPAEMEKAIREMPRDAEAIALLKKRSDKGRFPRPKCKVDPWSHCKT